MPVQLVKDVHVSDTARLTNQISEEKNRIVYLPEAGVQAVTDWLLIQGKAPGPLFYPLNKANKIIPKRMSEQGVLRALQRRGEKAEVDAFTPHDFRRTFIGNRRC